MITLQPDDYVALVKERDALRAENEKLKEALRELEEEKQAGWVEWLEGVNMAMFKEMQERIAELEQERGKVHNFIMSIKRWLYKNKGMPEPLWSDDIDEILALFESQSPSPERGDEMTEFTPEWITKARNACIFFGEPATTKFIKALDHIEHLQARVQELENSQVQEYHVPPESFNDLMEIFRQGTKDGTIIIKNLTTSNAGLKQKKIEQLEEINQASRNRIAELEEQQRWVPANEFIAKVGGVYYFEDLRGELLLGYLQPKDKLYAQLEHYAKRVFTMPLPPPPESEGE